MIGLESVLVHLLGVCAHPLLWSVFALTQPAPVTLLPLGCWTHFTGKCRNWECLEFILTCLFSSLTQWLTGAGLGEPSFLAMSSDKLSGLIYTRATVVEAEAVLCLNSPLAWPLLTPCSVSPNPLLVSPGGMSSISHLCMNPHLRVWECLWNLWET